MTAEQKTKLTEIATSTVGKPYKYGADSKGVPDFFDCSSLAQYLFKHIGIDIPRSSILQAADGSGTEITITDDFSNLETGDLLFMRGVRGRYQDKLFGDREFYIGHVVIYIGNYKVVQASSRNEKVAIDNINELNARPNHKIVLAKRF